MKLRVNEMRLEHSEGLLQTEQLKHPLWPCLIHLIMLTAHSCHHPDIRHAFSALSSALFTLNQQNSAVTVSLIMFSSRECGVCVLGPLMIFFLPNVHNHDNTYTVAKTDGLILYVCFGVFHNIHRRRS